MAVVTGTAVATGASLAATVAGVGGTALLASGVSATVGIATTAANMSRANKAKKAQVSAEAKASQAMDDARSKLETNFYAGLGVQKEPYELEREANLAANAQLMQAGQAGERGAGEIAGRALALNQQAAANTRTAMGKEMASLDKQVAAENSRLNTLGADMDITESNAAAAAAQQAGTDRMNYQSNALKSGLGVATSAFNAITPEYFKQPGGGGGGGAAMGTAGAGFNMDNSVAGFLAGQAPMNLATGQPMQSGTQGFMQSPAINPTMFAPGLGATDPSVMNFMSQYGSKFGN